MRPIGLNAFSAGGGSPPPSLVIDEQFGGSSGSIAGRAPAPTNVPAGTWTLDGTSTIDGAGVADVQFLARVPGGLTDNMEVEARFKGGSGSYFALALNSAALNSNWQLGVYPGTDTWELYFDLGGGYILRANGSLAGGALALDTWYVLKFKRVGQVFSWYLDGVFISSHDKTGGSSDDLDTASGVGIETIPSVQVDWFTLKDLTA